MNLVQKTHAGLLGTPARALATIFGSLLVSSSQVPPAVKEVIQALLLAL